MIKPARADREKNCVLMMVFLSGIYFMYCKEKAKSGRKFSARRRRRFIHRLLKQREASVPLFSIAHCIVRIVPKNIMRNMEKPVLRDRKHRLFCRLFQE